MAVNPYTAYYQRQLGSGIVGYEGYTHMRGSGWFSKLMTSAIVPSLKWLGLRGLNLAGNVVNDVVDGRNVRESLKDHGIAEVRNVGKVGAKKAQDYAIAQLGKGKKRKASKDKSVENESTKKKKGYKRGKKTTVMDFL